MAFKNYYELVDKLELPIGEITYTLPEISAKDGIRLALALNPKTDVTMSDDEFQTIMLGPVRDRMLEDGVPQKAMIRACLVAVAWWQGNKEAAEVMWERGSDPKALQEWADENTPTNRAQRRSKSTGAASSTKRPASTNGTKTSPKKSPGKG